jgi:hypothetical protein
VHIGVGAAILIIGLLWLATSKAGLKVLGVLAVLVVIVGGALGIYLYGVTQQEAAAHAAYQARLPEIRAKCEKEWPFVEPDRAHPSNFEMREFCERHPD